MTILVFVGAFMVTLLVIMATVYAAWAAWMVRAFTDAWPNPLWVFMSVWGLVLLWGAWWLLVGQHITVSYA